MQTNKIKIGEVYAYRRHAVMIAQRFKVTAIVTRKTEGETKSTIEGFILDDREPGDKKLSIEPDQLKGPIAEYEELRKRAEQEAADKKRQDEERAAQALQDRLALYAFVGEPAPKDPKQYHQMFGVSLGSVDIRHDGQKRIIERIRALGEAELKSKASA